MGSRLWAQMTADRASRFPDGHTGGVKQLSRSGREPGSWALVMMHSTRAFYGGPRRGQRPGTMQWNLLTSWKPWRAWEDLKVLSVSRSVCEVCCSWHSAGEWAVSALWAVGIEKGKAGGGSRGF